MKSIRQSLIIPIICYSIVLNGCSYYNNNTEPSPFDKQSATAFVIQIYDGDTFLASNGSVREKVRVLNVDCFETVYGTRLDEQAHRNGISADSAYKLGIQAKILADSLLNGKYVVLYKDNNQPDRDVYQRLLRIVEINGMRYDSIIIARRLNAN